MVISDNILTRPAVGPSLSRHATVIHFDPVLALGTFRVQNAALVNIVNAANRVNGAHPGPINTVSRSGGTGDSASAR